ncbi:18129_t:CDS:2, partial [Gigaspora rosea]
ATQPNMRSKKTYPYPSYKNPVILSSNPVLACQTLQELFTKIEQDELTAQKDEIINPEVNQDVPNSSVDQGPSNPNLSDITSDNEIDEAAIYVPLKIVRTINECNTWW